MTVKPAPEAHPVDVHVGEKVRLRRKELGLSQVQLAESCGVTFQQIQKYERGANRISASKLTEMAAILKKNPGWFLEDAPGVMEPTPADDAWSELAHIAAVVPHALEAMRLFGRLDRDARISLVGVMRAMGGDELQAA